MTGLIVFVALLLLTQLLAYQQYLIDRNAENDRIQKEAEMISNRLKTALSHSLSATKTLAFLVEKYGTPGDFDAIAVEIMQSNEFIDAVELTRKGVITHVYPLEGNRSVIGYDVLSDSTRSGEAIKALEKKALFFAGPLELRQGGVAVVGRLPIFRDDTFWGFSVVLIRLPTLLRAAGLDQESPAFSYQLTKVNPLTGEEERFISNGLQAGERFVSIDVPDGEWKLYVAEKQQPALSTRVISFSVLGILFSLTAGFLALHLERQPSRLQREVEQIRGQLDTQQKSARQSLERVNRLYHFTSRINQMVVHVLDEGSLYSQVCSIAVSIGKFKLAWIGLIDERKQEIFPVCNAGDEQGYLSQITPIILRPEVPEGPAKRMLRTGTYVHFDDISTDPLMAPWADQALARGFRSSILLPIWKFGKIVGSFNLYSTETYRFDKKEIELLLEVTNNISFTLENFEREVQRTRAEQQIQNEKMLSDSIINSLPGIFYLYDVNGKFFRWNRNFEEVSGYHTDEVAKMHPLDFFDVDAKELLQNKIADVFASGYADVIADFYTKDRRKIPYFFNGRKVVFNRVDYLIGMGLDVTERVTAEKALVDRAEEIEKLSAHLQNIREEERSRIALEIHDVLGQQLTALKMDATWLKKRSLDPPATGRIGVMISLIDDTIRTVRRISSELRPGILDDLGLIAALEWQGTEFEKNTGIRMQFSSNKLDVDLEGNYSTNLFRVYQEALTNIARHSNATEVKTTFAQYPDFVQLEVRDNGDGINFDEVTRKKSLGLIGMKERARQLSGEVLVENIQPHGTAVTVRVPLPKTNRA